MKKTILIFSFLVSIFFVTKISAADSSPLFIKGSDTLVVYKDVPGQAPSNKYTIRVRSAATNNVWVDVFANYTYNRADELLEIPQSDGKTQPICVQAYNKITRGWSFAYGNIEMNTGQAVEVEIAAKDGFKIAGKDFEKATIHPAQKASKATLVGGKIYFTITKPAQIYIDINGQMDDYNAKVNPIGHPVHTISLFANPVIKKPTLTGSRIRAIEPGITLADINAINPLSYDTMYFKPGVYDIGSGIVIHPGKTYYIPGDALIYGTLDNSTAPLGLYSKRAENLTIYGYGTISGAKIPHYQYKYYYPNIVVVDDKPIGVRDGKNAKIFGVTVTDNAGHFIDGSCGGGTIKWIKIIGWRLNSDGLGGYMDAEDCFVNTNDDCSYLKSNRIRCTFWKNDGDMIHLADIPENTVNPIIMEDCDVLYNRANWSGNGISQRGEGNKGQRKVNVIIRNVRFHDARANVPFISLKSEGMFASGASYSGFLFQNVSCPATNIKQAIMGLVDSPWDGGITFDRLTIGGTLVTQQNYTDYFTTNAYVSNISFIASEIFNVSLNKTGEGSVSGEGSFNKDRAITVTATPAANRVFVNWTENGQIVSTNAKYTFAVTQNRSLVATFRDINLIPHVTELTSWIEGNINNKVSANNRLMTVLVMGENSADFSANSVTYGGQTMIKQVETKIVNGSVTYAAIFTLNEVGVSLASSGNIAVSWTTTPSSGNSIYSVLLANVNQITPVSASAKYSLTGTTVATNALLSENGDMVIMCGATASNNVATVNNDFTKQFESNTSWGDGIGGSKLGTGTNETPSFSQSISGRMALTAIVVKYYEAYAIIKHTITTNTSSSSAGTITGANIYAQGQLATVTAIPNSGYDFVNWTENSNEVSKESIYSFPVTTSRSLQANFAVRTGVQDVVKNKFNIYPNPATNLIFISLPNNLKNREIRVYNSFGQQVHVLHTNNSEIELEVKKLNLSGLILIQIIEGQTVSNNKILVN